MAHVIGLIGEKLSGKDTAAAYLVKRYGAYHARHSHVLDDILSMLDVPVSRRNEIDLAMALRGVFGAGIVGKGLKKRVVNEMGKYPLMVMNGIRFLEEAEDVWGMGGKIAYVTAPLEVRFERFMSRQEKADDSTQSLDAFKQQEFEQTERSIPELGKRAEFVVMNTGSIEDLYGKIDGIMEQLGIEKQ